MELSIKSTVTLNNDVKMPLLGLRAYRMKSGDETYNAVRCALDNGYRLIDTAKIYNNEKTIGRALRDSGITREDLFVTTKLWVTDFDNPRQGLLDSLKRLKLEYADLYLIHWPKKGFEKVYEELVKLQSEGLCKAIGLCNFNIEQVQRILNLGFDLPPQVNQTEIHPLNTEKDLINFCRRNKITVEAYSPLGSEGRLILDDPRLIGMRDYYKATSSQILLRWCIQRGIVAIPKAVSEEMIIQNSQLYSFDITTPDMETISDMNCNDRRNYEPSRIDEREDYLYPKFLEEI